MVSIITDFVRESLSRANEWPIVVSASILMSFSTIFFDWFSTWLSDMKYGHCSNNVFYVEQACRDQWSTFFDSSIINFILVSLSTILFAALASFISTTNDNISKMDISELIVIIAESEVNSFLNFDVIWKKAVSLVFVLASGSLLVGYEGPLVHISCGVIYFLIKCLSNRFTAFQKLDTPDRIGQLLFVGVVIGISLAFDTPIGGLLFAIENFKFGSKLSTLLWQGFVCASMAKIIFDQLHPFKVVTINDSFTVGIENNWILIETIPYVVVGFVSGFLAIAFNKLHMLINRLRPLYIDIQNKNVLILEVVSVSFICLITTYLLPFSNLTMSEFLDTLFFDCSLQKEGTKTPVICNSPYLPAQLLYYLIILFFGTAYTYATWIPGGVLLPSLTMGALLGRVIGEFMQEFQRVNDSFIFSSCKLQNKSCISPGSYALVGAAAMFSGVTNTSISAVVIVLELSGAVTYLVPLMLGVFVSKTVNDILQGNSSGIFESWLSYTDRGYIKSNLESTMEIAKFSELTVEEVCNNTFEEIDQSELVPVDHLMGLISRTSDNSGLVILKSKYDRTLSGWISYSTIKMILDEYSAFDSELVTFCASADEPHIIDMSAHLTGVSDLNVVTSQLSALTAYEMLDRMNLDVLLVTNPVTNHYIGALSSRTMIELKKR